MLKLARGRRHVVELGTANGWTAIALALDHPQRQVLTFDPFDRPERQAYLGLVPSRVRRRIVFVDKPGSVGPGGVTGGVTGGQPPHKIELLYIDSSHDRAETIAEVRAWQGALAAGALIVFDDYTHPDYPGRSRGGRRARVCGGETAGTLHVVTVAAASPRT